MLFKTKAKGPRQSLVGTKTRSSRTLWDNEFDNERTVKNENDVNQPEGEVER